jgi:hypothetical protein
MIICRLLSLILLTLSTNCWAGAFGTSDKVYLKGGVCADDAFTIVQNSAPITDVHPKYEWFAYYEECVDIEKEEPSTYGANSFSCHPGGKTVLSGATYKMVKVRAALVDDNGSQVFIYECIKGCAQSPKRIRYIPILGGDCG